MTRLLYFFGKAFAGMRAAPFVHLVAALTIGLALTVGSVTLAFAWQANALLAQWGLRAELTLYLSPSLGEEAGRALATQAAELAQGEARYVTPAEALARLAGVLGEQADVLAGLPDNPLPASVEVVPSARAASAVELLAARLAALPGVDDVDYGKAWIDRVTAVSRAARTLALVLLPLVILGAAVLAGSVVRLGVYARREEIEIMQLVGATDAFVRAPFLVEGFVSGLVGGLVAAGALAWLAAKAGPELAATLPLPAELSFAALVRPLHLAIVVGAGATLGLLASAFSVGRHLRS